MTVKIPISADVTGAAAGLGKVEAAAKRIEKAVEGIDKASRRAADGLKRIEDAAKRADSAAQRISVGRPGAAAAGTTPEQEQFAENYDRARSDHFFKGKRPYRRWGNVITFPGGGQLGYRRGQEGGLGQKAASSAASGAFSFGRGMLAFAGITSLVAMASKAVDLASEEATTTDALKRSLGDLGVDFSSLRERVRQTGEGLGIAYVESVRLAQQFARASNARDGGSVASGVRTAGGFARAYGLDPSASVGFFGQMRLMSGGGGGGQDRHLALMIAEAIERGGFTAKADEVLHAVSAFTVSAARLTLSPTNVEGYAGALAGAGRLRIPGLDVQGAANILGSADSAIRRGGGMGEASMNFMYATLARGRPGLDPITARAMMEGGAFGSANTSFAPNSALGRYYRSNGLSVPTGGATNLTTFMGGLKGMYSDPRLRLDAVRNTFGLNSYGQAAGLMEISKNPARLGGLESLLNKAGVGINNVSATGYQTLARISGARGMGDLQGIAKQVLGREDLTGTQRTAIQKAMAGGDPEKARVELARAVSVLDEEKTLGIETLNSVKGISDALTKAGSPLLVGVNAIRDAVTAMAEVMAPNSEVAKLAKLERNAEKVHQAQDSLKTTLPAFDAETEKVSAGIGDTNKRDVYLANRALKRAQTIMKTNSELQSFGYDPSSAKAREFMQQYTQMHDIDPKNGGGASASSFEHNINVNLYDRNGNPIADPVRVRNSIPVPSGER